jgi:hypothetical protein
MPFHLSYKIHLTDVENRIVTQTQQEARATTLNPGLIFMIELNQLVSHLKANIKTHRVRKIIDR